MWISRVFLVQNYFASRPFSAFRPSFKNKKKFNIHMSSPWALEFHTFLMTNAPRSCMILLFMWRLSRSTKLFRHLTILRKKISVIKERKKFRDDCEWVREREKKRKLRTSTELMLFRDDFYVNFYKIIRVSMEIPYCVNKYENEAKERKKSSLSSLNSLTTQSRESLLIFFLLSIFLAP